MDLNIGDVVARLKIDLSGFTQGLASAQQQLRAFQQQAQALSQGLGTQAFTGATAALAAFERAIQGATFAQVAATTMQSANTQAVTQGAAALGTLATAAQATTQSTVASLQSTNQLATAYLAMAQATQSQTQAYATAQAAALAYRQQQDALREATRAAATEARSAGDAWRTALAVAGGIGIATSLQSIVSSVSRMVTDILAHLGRLVSESVTSFAQFEASVVKVGTLIDGFQGHGTQFDQLAGQIHAWAISSGKSTKDISAALFELVGDFGGVAQASTVMTQSLRLAEGGQTTVAITGKALSTIMLGLGLDMGRTAEAADVLARAAQINRGDLGEFAKAITPLLPALRESRLSFQSAAAALAVLTTQGRSTSEAVTGLSSVLLSILAPTARAEKTLKDLAGAMGVPRLEAKRFQDGTLDLIATLKQFEGMDLQVVRRSLGGNQQALLALEALILAHDQLAGKMKDMSVSAGTLAHEQALSAGTALQAWNKAHEAFTAFKDTLGQTLGQNPAVQKMLVDMKEGFVTLTRAIADTSSPLNAMLKQLGNIAGFMSTIGKGATQLLSGDFSKAQRANQLQVEIASLEEQKGKGVGQEQGVIGRFFNRLGQEAVTGKPATIVDTADLDKQITAKRQELADIGARMGGAAAAAKAAATPPAPTPSPGTPEPPLASPPRPDPTITMDAIRNAEKGIKAAESLRDALKSQAEQLQALTIRRQADLVVLEQGQAAGEKFAEQGLASLKIQQVTEAAKTALQPLPNQIAGYRAQIATLLTQTAALATDIEQKRVALQRPQLEAELVRLQTSMGQATASAAVQAQAAVLQQIPAMEATAKRALQTLRADTSEEGKALAAEFEQALLQIPDAMGAQGQIAFNKVEETQRASVTKMADEIAQFSMKLSAAGLSPLDADLAQITRTFEDMRAKLLALQQALMALHPKSTPEGQAEIDTQLGAIQPLLASIDTRRDAALTERTARPETAYLRRLQTQLDTLQANQRPGFFGESRLDAKLSAQGEEKLQTDEGRVRAASLLEQIQAQERLNYAVKLFEQLGGSIGQAWTTALFGIADGTKSVSQAFREMARSILQSLAQVAAQEGFRTLLLLGSRALQTALGASAGVNTAGGMEEANLGGIGLHAGGGMVNKPTLAMIGENPSTNPEYIFNNQQMQQFMASAGRAGPSAGGQAAGGNIAIVNVSSQAEADQQAAKYRSMGYDVTVNHVLKEMSGGEGSRIVRMMRTQQS